MLAQPVRKDLRVAFRSKGLSVCFGTQLVMRRGTDTLRAESPSPQDLRRSRAALREQKAILKLNSCLLASALCPSFGKGLALQHNCLARKRKAQAPP